MGSICAERSKGGSEGGGTAAATVAVYGGSRPWKEVAIKRGRGRRSTGGERPKEGKKEGEGAILKETAITEGRRLTRDGTGDFQERGSLAKKREMDDERG